MPGLSAGPLLRFRVCPRTFFCGISCFDTTHASLRQSLQHSVRQQPGHILWLGNSHVAIGIDMKDGSSNSRAQVPSGEKLPRAPPWCPAFQPDLFLGFTFAVAFSRPPTRGGLGEAPLNIYMYIYIYIYTVLCMFSKVSSGHLV